MTINSPKDFLTFVVATFLISSGVWMAVDSYERYQEIFNAEQENSEEQNDEWITYTNNNYGYEISYPRDVKFVKSSEILNSAPKGKEDQGVFIGDPDNGSIFNMSAGATIDYTANTIDESREKYISVAIPQLINGRSGEGMDLKVSDFVINEIVFNGNPAIEVISPLGYEINRFNNNGTIFQVGASNYTGATTTSKERKTRAIMETFRVLD